MGIRSPTEAKKPVVNQEMRSTQKDNHHGPLLPKKPITGSATKTRKDTITKQTASMIKSGRRASERSDRLSSSKSNKHSVPIAQDSSPKQGKPHIPILNLDKVPAPQDPTSAEV